MRPRPRPWSFSLCVLPVAIAFAASWDAAVAGSPPGEAPQLFVRVTQDDAVAMPIDELAAHGMRVFTTPFNKLDGYGDGPMDLNDTVSPGGRPTLQGNGTFLRVNGLDAQTCLECHSVTSAGTIPFTLGIGGVGTSNNNALIMPTAIDPADLEDFDETAGFNGRFANPPFLFGSGGVELLALEITTDLQAMKAQAIALPNVPVELWTKGVYFGTIVADQNGELDTTRVEGIESDLVVRPFGRKGEFATVRRFDIEALQFHLGMQPVEVVGEYIDADRDGVVNEILPGELSALHAFGVTLDRPRQDRSTAASRAGRVTYRAIGCADCHVPTMSTRSRYLPLRFPEVETDMTANVFRKIDLSQPPMTFERNREGGIDVPLFSDLKRHDMGDALAETFSRAPNANFNREFVTARLWGIADSAPYLHDGRATTLTEAILLHGGEAQYARDGFAALSDAEKVEVLAFLRTLRTPGRKAGGIGSGRINRAASGGLDAGIDSGPR